MGFCPPLELASLSFHFALFESFLVSWTSLWKSPLLLFVCNPPSLDLKSTTSSPPYAWFLIAILCLPHMLITNVNQTLRALQPRNYNFGHRKCLYSYLLKPPFTSLCSHHLHCIRPPLNKCISTMLSTLIDFNWHPWIYISQLTMASINTMKISMYIKTPFLQK